MLEHRHRLDDRRQQPDLAPSDETPILGFVQRERLAQPADVVQDPLGPLLGRPGDERVAGTAEQAHRPIDVLERQAVATEQPVVGALEQRRGQEVGIVLLGQPVDAGSLEDLDRGQGAAQARRRVGVAEDGDVDMNGGFQARIAVRVFECLEQQRQGLRRAVEVDDLAQCQQDAGAPMAAGNALQEVAQEFGRAVRISTSEPGRRGLHPQGGRLGRFSHSRGPRKQVGGDAGSTALDRHPGSAFQLAGDRRIGPVDCRRALDCPFERVVDRLGQRPAERHAVPPAACRRRRSTRTSDGPAAAVRHRRQGSRCGTLRPLPNRRPRP